MYRAGHPPGASSGSTGSVPDRRGGKGQAAKEAGSVPLMFMAKWISRTRERVKGEHRVPLYNPRGPAKKSALRTAFASRPAARSAPGGAKMSLWLSCGKTSQPWLKSLKTFTVSTVQNGLAWQAFIGSALTGWTKCNSLACSIIRGVRAVPGSLRPPYKSQPRIGCPRCWQ